MLRFLTITVVKISKNFSNYLSRVEDFVKCTFQYLEIDLYVHTSFGFSWALYHHYSIEV